MRSSMRRMGVAMLAALATATAAHEGAPPVATADDAGAREALAVFASAYPASPAQLPTTAGSAYLANLDARIEALAAPARRHDAHRAALAGALYHRYRLTGRGEDLRRVRALLGDEPGDTPGLRAVQATVAAGRHRFAQAEALLGERTADAESWREIDLALGRYDRVGIADAAMKLPGKTFYDTVWRGNLRVLAGDLDGATLLFRAAQSQYDDSSPVPLAWLYAQQGIAYLRFNRCAEAQPFLRASLERLPGYVLAQDHLAECLLRAGQLDEARRLYEDLVARTDDPEFIGQLRAVAHAAGDERAARRWQRQAAAAWRQALRDDESAYAQHAAEFYLDIGDAKRADELAQRNLAHRQDVLSMILAARTAQALGDAERLSRYRADIARTGLAPPELADLAPAATTARTATATVRGR